MLLIALVLDGLSRTVALRQLRMQAARRELSLRELLRESPDPTVVTVYFEDTIDVLGALLALVALVLHQVTGSALPDALASIVIGLLLCYLAAALTRRNRALLTNQAVPERYVVRLRDRLETAAEIHAVTRLEAVYLGPAEVLVAADVGWPTASPARRSPRVLDRRPRRHHARGPGHRAPLPDARGSGLGILVVRFAVDVVVEPLVIRHVEAGRVAPDHAGAVLVAVLGVLDQVGLGDVEALGLALPRLDQRRDRRVDGLVGVLGPFGHGQRLLRK